MERQGRPRRDLALSIHRVWLAGLGALARAQQEGGEDFFRDLVRKGKELEASGSERADLPVPAEEPVEDASEGGQSLLQFGLVFESMVEERARMERMIQAMMPSKIVPAPPAVLQARRNAAAREELIREFGALTSAEVAERAGSRARNKVALANRWKQEGRIFSVPHQGTTYYPGFQFDSQGRPRPVIAKVIQSLGKRGSDWELALWFVAPTGWLDGRRPVDLLESDPAAVIKAADHEAAPLVY